MNTLMDRRVKIIGDHELVNHIGRCLDYDEEVYIRNKNGEVVKNAKTGAPVIDKDNSTYKILFGFNSTRTVQGWHLTTLRAQ